MRLALWHTPLSRDGPGLLLRDLQREEPDLIAVADALRVANADIIVLTKVDFDADGLALGALADLVAAEGAGPDYAHILPLKSNEGVPSGVDLDGDGRFGRMRDAQGYGRFPGQGAMGVLSRFPFHRESLKSFNDVLWKDLPETLIAGNDSGRSAQRLSSGGHWIVPVDVAPGGGPPFRLRLLVGHSGPPVFDGPEDRNGRRNRDELRLWEQIIEARGGKATVFAANTNLDPEAGDGMRDAMAGFLARGWFTDPLPSQPTAHWDDPGPMRVSYHLPSTELRVLQARVWDRLPGQDHSLITVDVDLPVHRSP